MPKEKFRPTLVQVEKKSGLLGKKTLEAEILKEALDATAGSKKHLLRSLSWPKDASR